MATFCDAVMNTAEAASLPFPDQTFDAAVATLVLCPVKHPGKSLAELYRVLKPETLADFLHSR